MTDELDDEPVDPREARIKDVTTERWGNFLMGLSILSDYQRDLPHSAPVFLLEQVDGDEANEPGMSVLVAIANLSDNEMVHPGNARMLERYGWYQGGTWQYQLTVFPKW